MSDVATLVLQLDASPLTAGAARGEAALNKLTAAAAPATASFADLQSATNGIPKTQLAAAASADTHSESLRGQRLVLRAVASDLALFGGTMGQVAGEAGLLYIENAHLLEGFGGLEAAIGKILTPTNLLIGGFAAVAVGSVIAYQSIKATEIEFGNLSERTMTTVAALHALDSAAAFKGISSDDFLKNMEKFGDLTQQATDKMGSLAELFRANGVAAGTMNDNLYKAADLIKNAKDEASRYQIIQALGLPPTRQWVTYLSQGSDALRAAAANATQFGGVADEKLIAKAREFDEAWAKAWKNFGTGAKSGFVTALDYLSQFSQKVEDIAGKVANGIGLGAAFSTNALKAAMANPNAAPMSQANANGFYDTMGKTFTAPGAGKTPTTVDPNVLKNEIGLEQQRIGILGNLATVEDLVKEKENEIALARLAGVNITKTEENGIIAYTRAMALGVIAIQQQTNAQNVQASTVNMGVSAAAAFTAQQNLVNEAILKGKPLTEAQIATIHTYAQKLGEATQATAVLKATSEASFNAMKLGMTDTEATVATALRAIYGDDFQSEMNSALASQLRFNDVLSQTKNLAQDVVSGFAKDLASGVSSAQAFTNALQKIESKLIDMATNQLLSNLFKNVMGAFGGGVNPSVPGAPGVVGLNGNTPVPTFPANHTGGIAGTDATFRKYIHPAYFDNAPRMHEGGIVAGEVPTILKKGEGVFTPAQMAALGSGGGNNVQVNITNNSGGDVQHKQSSQNGVDVHEIIISAVNGAMSSGRFDQAQRGRYGTTPHPVGR